MRRLLWAPFAFALACSSTDATKSGADAGGTTPVHADPIPLDQFADRLAVATCTGVGACCAANSFAFNQPACEALVKSQSSGNVCPDGTAYDPQQAGDCIAALRPAYAACLHLGGAECDFPCVGIRPLGAACMQTSECGQVAGSTVVCWFDGTSGLITGVCSVLLRGTPGDACSQTCSAKSGNGTMEQCNRSLGLPGPGAQPATLPATPTDCYTIDGLFCGSDLKCRPRGAPGASCALWTDCEDGAYCDTASSKCVAKPVAGSPCGPKSLCADDAYCSATGCAAKRATGAPCAAGECVGACNTATGTCEAAAVDRIIPTAAMCAGT
jgi:hypothetical protein